MHIVVSIIWAKWFIINHCQAKPLLNEKHDPGGQPLTSERGC